MKSALVVLLVAWCAVAAWSAGAREEASLARSEYLAERGTIIPYSEVLLVGVQGRRYGFADLPPMNLVVVVDKSGSMGEPDKLEWVKESLLVLLDTLRDKDYLSSGTSTRCVSPSR